MGGEARRSDGDGKADDEDTEDKKMDVDDDSNEGLYYVLEIILITRLNRLILSYTVVLLKTI